MKPPFTPGFARYGSVHLWPELETEDFEEAKRLARKHCTSQKQACIITVQDADKCSVFSETYWP